MSLILDGSLGVTVNAGTAALPAIVSTTGTADTGLWFPAADTVAASTAGTERLRIDSSGNVGIGTTSPSYKLHSATNIGTGSTGNNGFVGFKRASDGAEIGSMNTDGTNLVVNTGTDLVIQTSGTERLRIDSSGNLLVGVTGTTMPNAGFALQPAEGNLKFRCGAANTYTQFYNQSNTQVGGITTNGTTVSYNTSSDYRLKEAIAPMTGALAKVALLKPCTYKWKLDGSDGQGFIAHELDEVVKGCVTGEKDAVETYTDEEGNEATRPAYQGIDTSFLVATLTAAIQELKTIIDTQAAQIAALNAKVGI